MAVAKNKHFLELFTEAWNGWNCSFLVLQNYIVGACCDSQRGPTYVPFLSLC